MKKLVACSEFVKRQIPESGYSHYNGSWEELEWDVEYAMDMDKWNVTPGYKDGVILVRLPHEKFYSGIVELDSDTKLKATYAPRREGEAAHINISSAAEKQPAKYASVVLYRHDVLAENNEQSADAEWEIVAIKARTSDEEEPMDPYTMARNFLHMKGGTKGDFTAEQFAQSIVYWNNHCMTTGHVAWYKKLGRKIKSMLNKFGLFWWNVLPDIEKF